MNDSLQNLSISNLVNKTTAEECALKKISEFGRPATNEYKEKMVSYLQTIMVKEFCFSKKCDYLFEQEKRSSDRFPADRLARLCDKEEYTEFLDSSVIPFFAEKTRKILYTMNNVSSLSLENYAKYYAEFMFMWLDKFEVSKYFFTRKLLVSELLLKILIFFPPAW
ncbi:hypothetical protein [endosymbiont GvMRE of Glomus versiforme]|uniref:hypothetical protein n=1 Tax=endosymbiont GvMRE of Glomus versiforme TaxID=2039283 RepID=UPI0011C3B1DF|nr:hypothetical protein [endosymbiont GvMRE of Glomus versiforme]